MLYIQNKSYYFQFEGEEQGQFILGRGADVAEGNTCQTQFWLKLTLLSPEDVQRLLRELEHNCTSRARRSPLECILADCGSREVASIQSPGCAPCHQRLRLLVYVLWGCFGSLASEYALCSPLPPPPSQTQGTEFSYFGGVILVLWD